MGDLGLGSLENKVSHVTHELIYIKDWEGLGFHGKEVFHSAAPQCVPLGPGASGLPAASPHPSVGIHTC